MLIWSTKFLEKGRKDSIFGLKNGIEASLEKKIFPHRRIRAASIPTLGIKFFQFWRVLVDFGGRKQPLHLFSDLLTFLKKIFLSNLAHRRIWTGKIFIREIDFGGWAFDIQGKGFRDVDVPDIDFCEIDIRDADIRDNELGILDCIQQDCYWWLKRISLQKFIFESNYLGLLPKYDYIYCPHH